MRPSPTPLARLLVLSLVAPSVSAARVESPTLCVQSCLDGLGAVHFRGMLPVDDYRLKGCQGGLLHDSLFLCVREYCTIRAGAAGLGSLNETCRGGDLPPLPPMSIIGNYTDEDVAKLKRIEVGDSWSEASPLGEVAIPSREFFTRWFETLDAVEYVYRYHFLYGLAMMVFWCAVIGIGMVNRLFSLWKYQRSRISSSPPTGVFSRASTWLRRNLVIPATFGRRCAQNIGWCTIPPRIQTATLVVFLLINIALSLHGYRFTEGNIYFPTTIQQVLRYVSDRTGIISFANFPVIWLFGMRNNVALWLTGWDFSTYNNFHRWVARTACLQAVVHSVGYTVLIFYEGGWEHFASWWSHLFWWTGELATIFMCALVLCSVYWLRRRHYEFFLIIHIILSILILITMLGHVSIFNGQYDALFWVPVFIWLLDRLIRAARIFAFSPKSLSLTGYAVYNSSSNIVRLNIPLASNLYKPQPGTYYYLMVLDGARGWESHPFTVASTGDISNLKSMDEQIPLLDPHDAPLADEETAGLKTSGSDVMTFLIRPYDSFTKRLQQRAESEWPRPAPLRLLIEGPYGHTLPFHTFDHIVFIVGGSGIVLPLSYLRTLTEEEARPNMIEIHWALREPEFANDVIQHDIPNTIQQDNLVVKTYIKPYLGQIRDDNLPDWVVQNQKGLDVASAVVDAVGSISGGSIAIVACGPARLADEARRTTVEILGRGGLHVEYFEEGFSW